MRIILSVLVTMLFACNNNPVLQKGQPGKSDPASASGTAIAEGDQPAPDKKSVISGKGSLSFKMDGVLVESDPNKTKCWAVINLPMAMMMAKGDNMTAGWQMPFAKGQTSYKLDAGSSGASFTVSGVQYGTRQRKENYINIELTNVKDYHNVYLLSGTFEGVVENNDGKKVTITEGRFVTESL